MQRIAVFLVAAACAASCCLKAAEMQYTISDVGEFIATNTEGVVRAEIPEGVTKISAGCFWSCETLEEVVFPESLEWILSSAFSGCTNLKSVEIPDGVRVILTAAFRDCLRLEFVKLPELLPDIKTETFAGCESLREIELPVAVTNIGDRAFGGCKSLCRVFVRRDVRFARSPTAFDGCPSCFEIIRYNDEIDELPWVEVTLDPNGGSLETSRLRTIRGYNYGLLPVPQREGYAFEGWWTRAEGGKQVVSTTKVKDFTTLYAHWRLLGTGDFYCGGDAEWVESPAGTWQSAPIKGGQSTWLRTMVEGPGELSFEWRLSYRHPTHYTIDLFVDNDKIDTISFATNWLSVTSVVDSPGVHTFEWLFSKVPVAGNECYALVRNITWTPLGDGAALPYISAESDEAAVMAAVEAANFADTNVAAIIGGDAARYEDFRDWANGVADGAQDVVASRHAAAAYLLGAQELFEDEPRIAFRDCAVQNAQGIAVSASFLDGDAPLDVSAEKVAALFEMTSDLNDWEGDAEIDFAVVCDSPGQASSHTFRLIPSDTSAKSVFLRINPAPTSHD